jgi:DNA-binding Lrp family transcriptional regulator
MTTINLDDMDYRLIAALRVDGRAPMSLIAKRLGISRSTAEKRLARLVGGGVILGFTVRARDARPDDVRAIMLIEVAGRSTSAVIASLKGLPQVHALHTTNGGWDLVADLRARDLQEFDRVLREIRLVPGVLNSETSLLLTSV